MILAGDIGGTKTTLGIFSSNSGKPALHHLETFSSQDSPDFTTLITLFLKNRVDKIDRACFGIAGPVDHQTCTTTHLSWMIDAEQIGQQFKIPAVWLLNDLEATAYGTLSLTKKETVSLSNTVQISNENKGNRAVIAAGTGLGEATLYWDGVQHRPAASEGGHGDFAPRNPTEIALLEFLLKRHGRVSYERVLSGPGLVAIYQFLKAHRQFLKTHHQLLKAHRQEDTPDWLDKRLKSKDPADVISTVGQAGDSPLCTAALDLFVSIYGAEAGNLALRTLATGGVYVGGGIAPKILKTLQSGVFMKAFLDKGRYSPLLSKIPVEVILEPKTALYGAAAYAAWQSA